jgi:hypothetical protein
MHTTKETSERRPYAPQGATGKIIIIIIDNSLFLKVIQ